MSNTLLHLRRLRAKDFKRHAELEVSFEERLTVIRGPNGSGKSSILHAVMFALFGALAVPGGKSAIIRTGAKNCDVTLMFDIGDSQYSLRRTATVASLHDADGAIIANGTSAVTDYVLDQLGMKDYKDFGRFSYSAQGDTQALLTLGSTEVNRIVEKLAGADYIDRITNRAKTKISTLHGELNALGAARDLTADRAQVATAKGDMDKYEAAYGNAEHEYLRLAPLFDATEQRAITAMQRNESARNVAQNRTRVLAAISEREERIRSAEQTIGSGESREACGQTDNHTLAAKRYSAAREDRAAYTRLSKEIANASAVLADLELRVRSEPDLLDSIDSKQEAVNDAEEKISALTLQIHDHKADLARCEKGLAENVCPECERPFDAHHKALLKVLRDGAESAIKQKEPVLNGLVMSVGALKRELVALQSSKLTERDKQRYTTLSAQHTEMLEQQERLTEYTEEDLSRLSTELSAAEAVQRKRAGRLAVLDLAERNKQEAETSLSRLRDELATLPDATEQDITTILRERDELRDKTQAAKESMNEAQYAYSTAEIIYAGLVMSIEEEEQRASKRSSLESRMSSFSTLSRYLTQNKSRYLLDVWNGAMATVSQFTNAATDGKIASVSRDAAGDFYYVEDDETRPVAAASGGQRSMMGIGMRLALGSLQPAGAGLLLLDEPSADLDENWSATMAGALIAQERQIVLVTHRAGEEYSAMKALVLS